MNVFAWIQMVLYVTLLLLFVRPLGAYVARVYGGGPLRLQRVLGPVERLLYRLAGVRSGDEMDWRATMRAVLLFNVVGFVLLHLLQRLQGVLPLNPAGFGAVTPHSAFNTAVSFVTNTNWQSYSGETTMSYFTQMMGLTVQNFVSAATGMAVLAAVTRGFVRREARTLGNFWVDLVRTTLYVLLPLSFVLALGLASQGVVQTFRPAAQVQVVDPVPGSDGKEVTEQTVALGPAASQVAIKQLGTNGGGFYNVNSAHPLENSTPLSNFLQCLATLLLSAALCHTFGVMAGDARQGRALLIAMLVLFIPLLLGAGLAERGATPALAQTGVDATAGPDRIGGNMEGKEVRFGIGGSATWAVATTAASNGSVNAMHDSFSALGGLIPMWLMQLGEVVFGGVGSGLYGMLAFAVVAVFVAGLMVGRTPEYLGKKIEAFEMQMASLAILGPCLAVLVGAGIAAALPAGRAGIANPGIHGFSEILYAFSSAGNNNGSAFAGLSANTPFYNLTLGIAMLVARFVPIAAMLSAAGSLVRKKTAPAGPGTLPTHQMLFVALLVAVIVIVGALTFLPALALGPIVEHLTGISGGRP